MLVSPTFVLAHTFFMGRSMVVCDKGKTRIDIMNCSWFNDQDPSTIPTNIKPMENTQSVLKVLNSDIHSIFT